jgi:hypothetical protein
MNWVIAPLLILLFFQPSQAQELIIYPAPAAVIYSMHNDDYTVRVRKPGGEWQDLFEYNVKVDADRVRNATMVYFDFSGAVEVYIRKNNGNVQAVRVRPFSKSVQPLVKDNSVRFTLKEPANLSVEFNGNKLTNLHLFAGPIEKYKPDTTSRNVVYFGPGVHYPPDTAKTFVIPSGKKVYIDGSAILRGKILCDHAENISISGRGIIDQPARGVEITHSKNIRVEGLIFINPQHYTIYGGESSGLEIQNIKSFSARGWSDGIDLMSCSDVHISHVFMRNSDDCIAIYGHRWKYYGDARNYSITNSTLWADVAHPINIGLHGDTRQQGELIENIQFKDIDILEQDEDDPDYEGCMAITTGDLNLVRNIRFENIRVDDFEEGRLFSLRTVYNKKYNTGPGRGIQEVYFKNISYTGSNIGRSVIEGLDSTHAVKGVVFENLRINGRVIRNAASGNIKIGAFATDVSFKK